MADNQVKLTLTNPVDIARKDELVVVKSSELNGIDFNDCSVYVDGKAAACQAEDIDFDGKNDSLAFLVDMKAGDSFKAIIKPGKVEISQSLVRAHAEMSIRADRPEAKATDQRIADDEFVLKKVIENDPAHEIHDKWYRFEGPLIESEKAGYRLYWDKRGIMDAYGKTSDMSIGEYHRGNHHTLQPWGRDILNNPGGALGVGGLGIGDDTAERFSPMIAPYSKIIVGNDGPVRASFRFQYNDLEYKGQKYDMAWDVSMSAGQHYMTQKVHVFNGGELDMMAGLTNFTASPDVDGRYCWARQGKLNWVGSYGDQVAPDHDKEKDAVSAEDMGLGLLWKHELSSEMKTTDREFDVLFKPVTQLEYYSLHAYNYEKESPIMSSEEFYIYMEKLSICLANPIQVSF